MVGQTLQNGLRIREELGSTPDGPLYLAELPAGEEVALLILASGEWPDSRYRQAAEIRHPNVAEVREAGELPDGSRYVVLECLAGEPLSEILAERGGLPPHEAVDLTLQAAAGLEAAHRAGLVHANLSPDAMLVTRTPDGPVVKLIGFSLVSSLPPAIPKPTGRDVAVDFASPERLAGHAPDERSDVFSLAAVLHHLLAGGFVSTAMRAAVGKAMLPIPEHRFQTIAEFAAEVRRAAGLVAAPARTRRRRPALITAGSALAVVAGGFWLLASRPGPEPPAVAPALEADTGAQGYVPSEGMETGSAPEAGPADEEPEVERPRTRAEAVERAINGDVPRDDPPEPVATAAPATAAPATAAPATAAPVKPAPVRKERAAATEDTVATTAPAPAALGLDERAQIGHRIGLDEASRHLGAPVHAIEGMSPLFVGLARGRFPEGADTTRPLVRAVYLDASGALILLDQQRTEAAPRDSASTANRWARGDVMLYLQGDGSPAALRNLARRVR